MTTTERPIRLQRWMNDPPAVLPLPKAPPRPWFDAVTCAGIIALLILVGVVIEVSTYTKNAAIDGLWREAERRGFAERYYEGAGDVTPSWRWKEQPPS